MTGVFACPECGLELVVEGLSPGREVLCEECSTWVEVPYLPRSGEWKRSRRTTRASPWASKTLRGAIVFAAGTLLALMVTRMIGGQVRTDRERVLAELVASADEAESSRRYDLALIEIEGALSQARTFEREGSTRLLELQERRDRASIHEAEARLARVGTLDPDRAVGEALILADRARRDPALAPLLKVIEARVGESRLRQAEVDLALARSAFGSGRDAEAFVAAERLHDRAGKMAEPASQRFRDEARAVLEAAVGRSGVALPPVAGRFVLGSSESYALTLDRSLVDALKDRGYLPSLDALPGRESGTRKPRSSSRSRSWRPRTTCIFNRRTGRPRSTASSSYRIGGVSPGRPAWSAGPARRCPAWAATSPATSPPPTAATPTPSVGSTPTPWPSSPTRLSGTSGASPSARPRRGCLDDFIGGEGRSVAVEEEHSRKKFSAW